MAYPVRNITEPAALRGQTNGQLSASILRETPGQAGGPGVLLLEPATRAWRALCAAAKKDGHTLKLSGALSAYRPYADQERIFRQRFTTTPNGRTSRRWNGRTWYLRPGVALAAVPGTSNHGRGLAVDVGEERDGDTGTESLDSGTLAWLLKNEERFGWSHEVQSEPWHLRYFAGDRIPQAVLDYERGTTKGLFMHLTEAEEREILTHLRHLDPWPPEKLNSLGEKDASGKPAARHLRWISESLNKLRRL